MFNALRLYWHYIMASVRSQMQYRASFIMMALGQFGVTIIEFAGVWALFSRFDQLQGWRLPEVALLYGIVSIAFAAAEAAARGFDMFPVMVKRGDFDRILVRPRSTALQIGAQDFQLMRIGRLSQGVVVLLWGAAAVNVAWTLPKLLLLLAAIAGGACLFSGLFVLQATMAFWSTESLELFNCVTYGGTEIAQYPVSVYKAWFRRAFTFFVPLATISYFPIHGILGRPDVLGSPVILHWLAPVAGFLFLLASLQVWKFGVRHYRSTGS